MSFFRRYQKLHIWLMILAAFFAVYFRLRRSRTAMNWLCGRVLLPMEQALGRLCGHLSISVAEVLIISAACTAFFALATLLRKLITAQQKRQTLYRFGMGFACAGLTLYALFCLFWGTLYNTDSFCERSGISAHGGTVAQLTALTEKFAGFVQETADEVPRGETGEVLLTAEDVFLRSQDAFSALYTEFPFLDMPTVPPKAFVSSRAMSALDFTGFYFPFTGEANLNVDAPGVYLPATCCHEIAHQKGVASEQECNFLGILAALRSEDADFRYSGALMGYVYASNALYSADHDAWRTIRSTLPESAIGDLQMQSDYWAQFAGPVKTVSNRVYDGFLKSNGDENGIRSYGMVVDLLLGYQGL